jgi:prepilin-type N-terminal cleavage/methylation domain-containing protein
MKTAPKIQEPEARRQKTAGKLRKVVSDRNASACPASHFARDASRGFSLIELLVVIAVIVVLAAMTFPAMTAVKVAQARHRAQAELSQIETAIENYKTKLGFYPPDNHTNVNAGTYWGLNQLYYELMGSTMTTIGGKAAYQTLDGSASILNTTTAFKAAFGPNTQVTGFMNCSKAGAGDDAPNAVKFLVGLKPGQYQAITNGIPNTAPVCTLLGSAIGGPIVYASPTGEIAPYGYNSSNPQHNPKSFDLWIDIVAGGKTNRISNWSARPIFVNYPPPPAPSYPP